MTDGNHDHPLIAGLVTNEQNRAMAAESALAARIAALEAGVPPVTPPSGRPFALPVTTRTVQIPPSIDAKGISDITAALKTFISTVPDGSIITGAGPTAIYRISQSVLLGIMKGRTNLIFDGQGATLNNVSPPMPADANSSSNKASSFYWHYDEKPFPQHITIRNWVGKAANPKPGVLNGSEFAAFAHVMGGQFVELDNITAFGLFGDLLTLNEDAQNAYVHGSHVIDCGRNNISIVCGSHVTIEDNNFDASGYCVFDIEPEPGSIAGITDVTFRRNKSGKWANAYFAMDGVDAGKPISNIVLDANTSTVPVTVVAGGKIPKARAKFVSYTGNKAPSGSFKFQHIDGLTTKGNTPPVPVGAFTDCPAAVPG